MKGNILKDWFRSRGIGQAEIASFLGISISGVSRMLNGNRNIPYRRAFLLNQHFGIPLSVIYADVDVEGD